MMNLPQNAISELQEIYIKEFGVKLSEDAARAEARRLLLFFHQFLLFMQSKTEKSKSFHNKKIWQEDIVRYTNFIR